MRIYVAGPYSKGDVAVNVKNAVFAADIIVAKGHTPYIPHLTHFWHMLSPRPYGFWLDYDAEWLTLCDALYRIPGESMGADTEVAIAERLHLPIYYRLEDIP